jgi:hypothetical protein
LVLIVLGLWLTPRLPISPIPSLFARFADSSNPRLEQTARVAPRVELAETSTPIDVIASALDIQATKTNGKSAPSRETPWQTVEPGELTQQVGQGDESSAAAALAGRHPSVRAKMVASGGGTIASEDAVARGLRWLQAHQRSDGSWHFNHHEGPCKGWCSHPGKLHSTTAATALALLPFLGSGHTHRQGDYQPTVTAALYYLKGRMKPTSSGGDFQEGTMYAQGLVGIALAEALAMTGDESLRPATEAAVEYIVYAQDKNGGGWRYTPGQPGDMSVTGWQFMALRSGQMSYLRVPADTIDRAISFLDHLSGDGGATYGYLKPGTEPTNTAVGLLCRMYTGWRRETPALARGMKYLAAQGPSPNDIYFNYYATQAMHHWGGPEWTAWNVPMRESLIASQATSGHESGSWYFEDAHKSGVSGGRLYNTCMAIMTLEVYYRYLPLYGKRAVNDSF